MVAWSLSHIECGGKRIIYYLLFISLMNSRCSLQIKRNFSQKEKDNCFITRAAWLSSELNVHCLTALIILVSEGRLPSYAMNTHLFSSQPCEATFRSARSLAGTLSSITNLRIRIFTKNWKIFNFKSSKIYRRG